MPFAPAMAMELSTHVPKAPPAIVAKVTQADGESAIRSVDVVFPVGFVYNERFTPPRCQPDQEEAEACPPGSKIGTVSGVSPIASASGDVYVTDDLRLVSFVKALGGAIKFKVVGTITLDPSGGFAVTFTGTPNLPLRSFELDLEGDDLSLVKNPSTCGDFHFKVTFSSYDGDVTHAAPTVPITGCPAPLRVSALRATTGRHGVRLRWQTTEGTQATRVVLRRRGHRIRARTVKGTAIRFRGLKHGKYVAVVRARGADSSSPAKRVSFTVPR